MVTLAAGLSLSSVAKAESIKADVDGDGKKDLVVASSPQAGTTRVGLISSKRHNYTYLDFAGNGAAPWFRKKGDVNSGKGAELFVRTGSNPVVDTIQVLTFAHGKLTLGRSFYLDPSLSNGLAIGMKCGQVKGGPGIRAYVFRLGKKGRWHRYVTPYAWDKGRLVRRGRKTDGRVPMPDPSETTLGCPKPKAPPEPPPVLGRVGNRYFIGLGKVEPKSFRARHGSGRYFGFSWKGWGNGAATASGSFNIGVPGAGNKGMSLRAFDLGQCAGKKAYRRLTLKPRGQSSLTLNVC